VLESLPLLENSDDFVFDNQMLAQAVWFGFKIAEITCPPRYFDEASSINFQRRVKYGIELLRTGAEFRLAKLNLLASVRFSAQGRKLPQLEKESGTA